jgi:hypothetical protein
MQTAMKRTLFLLGVFFFASMGALVGSWTFRGQYPVSEKERYILTTQVKGGDPVQIARVVDRRDNCEITVKGYMEYSSGLRIPIKQTFEPGFGPLGYDGYIMEIPTSVNAPHGEAYAWTKPASACNPLEYLLNLVTPGQEKIDRFMIGDRTITRPVPPELKVRRPAAAGFKENFVADRPDSVRIDP